nr:isopentenyl-diphosphate Delta-isomerase 1-like [Rhipicephalus microplus]
MIRNAMRKLLRPQVGISKKAMAAANLARAATTKPASEAVNLDLFDPTQVQLLEEQCILVDEQDRPIGSCSKKDCHLMENINKGFLHRAFSVFLFNSKNELLLQQRSDAKITFPGRFTNTCCSHPLHIPDELEEANALGVKKAAQRRLFIELGIDPKEVPVDEIRYLTRILYKAPSDSTWGENEVDYILFVHKDVAIKANPNEVKDYLYISREDISNFISLLEVRGQSITPWFKLVLDNFLFKWWESLDNLKKLEDHGTIHHLTAKTS